MYTAKCLYLGGLKIHANDKRLIYSYDELGLRCCYCGEKVLYRNGGVNQPHFAHHKDIHEYKMAECLLRQRNEGYTTSLSEISSAGRHQRFKIFQESFLELITFTIFDCMQKSQWRHPLSISVSKKKKISLSNNKNDIMFGNNRLASIEAQYVWHQRDKLQLNHFFKPNRQYKLFLNTIEEKEALIDIFREWLELFDVKIPLHLGE